MDNQHLNDTSVGPEEINMTWVIYILVWFFLGGLGIHRFMAGKIGTGIGMLLLLILGVLLLIVLVGFLFLGALGIWWIIDGIQLLSGRFKTKEGIAIKMKRTIS